MEGVSTVVAAKISSAEAKLIDAIKDYLSEKGEDINRDGLIDTPERFVKQLNENLRGYSLDPNDFAKVFDSDGYTDLIYIRDIDFSSQCEHHMVPFMGKVDVAYLPDGKILGLSKFARIVDAYGKRLQVQERLTKQVADLLEDTLKPKLLIVRMVAQHTCIAKSFFSVNGRLTERLSGISYYKFIKDLAENFDLRKEKLYSELNALIKKYFVKERLIISLTVDEEIYDKAVSGLEAIVKALPSGEKMSDSFLCEIGRAHV